jgi:hypothetical protein
VDGPEAPAAVLGNQGPWAGPFLGERLVPWGMATAPSSSDARRRKAAEVLAGMGRSIHDAKVLSVQCASGHHVAAVFRTPDGEVIRAATGRRSHGNRDRVDTPHGSRPARVPWSDFLDAGPHAGTVPAWCDCGAWTLSRADLIAWLDAGEYRVVLESKA